MHFKSLIYSSTEYNNNIIITMNIIRKSRLPSCVCRCLGGEVRSAGGRTDDPEGLSDRLSDERETRVEVLRVVHRKEPGQQIMVEHFYVFLLQTTPVCVCVCVCVCVRRRNRVLQRET